EGEYHWEGKYLKPKATSALAHFLAHVERTWHHPKHPSPLQHQVRSSGKDPACAQRWPLPRQKVPFQLQACLFSEELSDT
ncbi:MAG: hypothetical protein WBW70_17465, partial [Candidatus Sulfotelmatobacter sp.]